MFDIIGDLAGAVLGNSDQEKADSKMRHHDRAMFGRETSRMREFWDKESQRIDQAHWRDRGFLDQSQKNVLEQITLGNQMDMSNQKEMFDYRINQGIQAGMTPYEMYMGPAAGAGGGTSGSGNTLGNSQVQKDQQIVSQAMQREENIADRELALMQAKLQAETQIGTSQIAAEASKYQANASLLGNVGATAAGMYNVQEQTKTQRYTAEIAAEIQQGKLDLDTRTYEETLKPAAAANIGKTEKETEKLLNEIATSTPEFVRQMKKWSMGVDNMMVEYFSSVYGVDITNPDSIRRIPKSRRKEFLAAVMAFQSNIGKEMAGIGQSDAAQGIGSALGIGASILGNIPSDFFSGWSPSTSFAKKKEKTGSREFKGYKPKRESPHP